MLFVQGGGLKKSMNNVPNKPRLHWGKKKKKEAYSLVKSTHQRGWLAGSNVEAASNMRGNIFNNKQFY